MYRVHVQMYMYMHLYYMYVHVHVHVWILCVYLEGFRKDLIRGMWW